MKPTLIYSETAFRGLFDVRKDRLAHQDGRTADYTSIVFPWSAVVVLARDTQGRYVLNREYRHPVGHSILGCPGGRLEEGEDPRMAAERELLEETGYGADKFYLMGSCYPFPGLCNQKMFFFFADHATLKGAQNPDPFEFIEIELKSEEELKGELRSASLVDGLLCAALWYKNVFAPQVL